MGESESGTDAAQIYMEMVIERNESEASFVFNVTNPMPSGTQVYKNSTLKQMQVPSESDEQSRKADAFHQEELKVLRAKHAKLDNCQHEYAHCRQHMRLKRAEEMLAFDTESEQHENFLTDSFAEVEQRWTENLSNAINLTDIEVEIEATKTELREERDLLETDRKKFWQRMQAQEKAEEAERDQLKAEQNSLVILENEMLSELGGK